MPLEGHVVQASVHRLTAKLDPALRLDEILKKSTSEEPKIKSLRYLQSWSLYHLTVKTPFYLDESSFTDTCVHYLSFYNCTSLKRVWLRLLHSHPLVVKTTTRLQLAFWFPDSKPVC